MHETISHNLLLLLREGAFADVADQQLLPMSQHKWRRLVDAAAELNVLRYVSHGAEMMRGQKYASPTLFAALDKANAAATQELMDISSAELYNRWTNRRLEETREEEMNAQDTSDETLTVLDFVVRNAQDIITQDVNVEGIVSMGCHLREQHEKINFEKLDAWFSHIGLVQIASLEGCMLVQSMGFTEDELPFVKRHFKRAGKQFLNSMTHAFSRHSFSTSTRLDVAMLETVSYHLSSAIRRVTDIEE